MRGGGRTSRLIAKLPKFGLDRQHGERVRRALELAEERPPNPRALPGDVRRLRRIPAVGRDVPGASSALLEHPRDQAVGSSVWVRPAAVSRMRSSPPLVCARCGAVLSTMAEAMTHCPSGQPADAWPVSDERPAANPAEHCLRTELGAWPAPHTLAIAYRTLA